MVIGIIGVLLAILVPVLVRVRESSRSVRCVANLRQIGAALQAYAGDNQGRLPDPGVADKSWEQMVLRYHEGTLACPSDTELFPAIGSSYDWRDTGRPSTTMAGKLLADANRTSLVLAFELLPGWHAKGMLNVLQLDGSVRTVPDHECYKDLETPVREGVSDETPIPKENPNARPGR